MTKPKELKVGDRVRFVRTTLQNAAWSPKIGESGTVDRKHPDGYVIVQFDTRSYPSGFERTELRKLPDRKEGA